MSEAEEKRPRDAIEEEDAPEDTPEALQSRDGPRGEKPGTGGEGPRRGRAVADFFSLDEIFQRILATADEELTRPVGLLFWSGLAGGLVLGLGLVARAVLTEAAGGDPLVGNLLYPIGFVVLVLGRYQLFTENTLTPVTLVLTRLASFRDLGRIWGVVLGANLLGALAFAALLGALRVLTPEASEAAVGFGEHLVEHPFGIAFGRAVMAGWLLALLVWLVHAARDTVGRLLLIWMLIYFQVTADLFHSVVGSVEVFYAVLQGSVGLGAYLVRFLVPVLLGNAAGGVVFVALLNYAQFSRPDNRFADRGERLPVRTWLLGETRTES